MTRKPPPNWICESRGPQNNGRLKECKFETYFDPQVFSSPHCPQCGSKMKWVSQGPSVADLLRRGMEAEKNK